MPPSVISRIRSVGDEVERSCVRSSATASIAASMSPKFPDRVTSETGRVSLPLSIRRPAAPRLKSPVAGLKPKPIMLSQYKPYSTSAIRSSGGRAPAARKRLELVSPGLPLAGREEWPVGDMRNLRAP